MDSSASTSVVKQYQVFLSFRGEDTRRTIVSHLHKALIDKGIDTFKDDKKLEIGDSISAEIKEAIQNSKVAVVVISENYASSTWCLNELQMIMELHKKQQLTAVPIFYDVTPSDVRHQRQTFSLEKYKCSRIMLLFSREKRKLAEKIQKWREALTEIAGISGKDSRICEDEAAMIEDIVGRVSRQLFSMETAEFSDIVGMDSHMEELSPLLQTKEGGVQMIGISGMGGVGKTTIAKYLYEVYLHQFAQHCFIENVKSCAEQGLIHLQEKLLSSILGKEHEKPWSVEQGCLYIKSRFRNRKVLLVLDDVDNLDQLHALAKETSWFGPGSRIIITTRDKGLLISSGVRTVYRVDVLDNNNAIQVFKQVAFEGGEAPSDAYEQLSIRASSIAQGLPSALKAFGTYLRQMTSIKEWEQALGRLEKFPHQRIMEILRTSYKGLDWRHQSAFLNVACLFNGYSVKRVTSLLDDGELEIKGLEKKSLIDVSADDFINMHVLVEQAGKEFARVESDFTPWRQRVLWEPKQIIYVLQNDRPPTNIQSLALNMCEMLPRVLYIEGRILNTIDLKFLKVFRHLNLNNIESKLQFLPGTDDLPQQLRLLHWDAYPLTTLPPTYSYNLDYLVEIILRHSNLEQLWSGNPDLPMLRRLDMTSSHNLREFPGLLRAQKLEELLMEGSTRLQQLPECIGGSLSCLRTLNLSHCDGLAHFPIHISENDVPLENRFRERRQIILQFPGEAQDLRFLANLSIEGRIYIELLHLTGEADHISFISEQTTPDEVMMTPIEGVPQSPGFSEFKSLHIKRSRYIEDGVPFTCNTFSGLPFLAELKLINLNIEKIPDNIDHLQSLQKLDLSGNDFKSLPTTMENLSKLRSASFCNCIKLEALPKLTQLQTLKLSGCSNLRSLLEHSPANYKRDRYCLLELGLDNCKSVQCLSDQLSHFTSLIHLDLSRHDFVALPASIRDLTLLGTLCLNNCKKLKSVKELPRSLKHLYAHGCNSLENVSLSCEHFIEHLDLSHCFSLKEGEFLLTPILEDGYSQSITPRFVCLPGAEVPSYFDNQALETPWIISLPSIRITPRILGIAACVMIACKTPFHLQFDAFTCSWNCEPDGLIRVELKPNLYLLSKMEEEEVVSSPHLAIIFVPSSSINTVTFDRLRLVFHLFPEESLSPVEIRASGVHIIFQDGETGN